MKTIKAIIILTLVSIFTTTTYAAEVPRESAPCNATNEAIVIVESFIGNILTDSERINERYNEAQRLEQEAMMPKKHKKKDGYEEHSR